MLIALAAALLAAYAAREESLTWDEPVFIVAGLSYWQHDPPRINLEAPPLAQRLLALPLLFLDLPRPDYGAASFNAAHQIRFASDYLASNPAALPAITRWARLPVWLATFVCVSLAGLWARALYGPLGAVTAALGVAVSPSLMAHGRLATCDYLCATSMLAASYLLWRALRSGRWRDWLGYGAALAAAITIKFTALLLLPLALLTIGYEVVITRRPLPAITLRAGAAAALCLVLISFAYGRVLDIRPLLEGLAHIYGNSNPAYHSYLFGTVLERSAWYYYPLVLLLKTPLPALLLLAAALIAGARHPRAGELAVYLLAPAAVMIGVSCFDTINVGIRRILPALPMLAIFSALVVSAHASRRRVALAMLALVWMVIEAGRYFPDQLAYLNTLAGGPQAGPYVLDESNIDWGQELPRLARWQALYAPHEKMYLSYFGTMTPALYGVRSSAMGEREYRTPAAGLYALSTHQLVWLRKIDAYTHAGLDWLTRYQPVDRIGYSIYLYRFPPASARAIP